jgi:AraC-like DNA-binding protein
LAANRPFRQTNELLLGAIVIIARTMLGRDWAPICTYVAYPEPAPCDRAFYRRAFGNQLQFNADFNGMAVVPEDLDRSRENHDPGLAHHAERLIDRLAEPGDPDFLPAVQQALGYLLGSSRGTMAEVAASLNLHPRTLQRRLQREGVRFRELVHETRVRLAARFVANPNLRIAEIAEALGYSSTGAFSRWFRHEFGRPPTQYR